MDTTSVLFVEDDPDIAELLRYAFYASGFSPEHHTNGEEALQALDVHHHPLVILDIMLPGMDGIEVLKTIRQNPRLTSTAVILLTARGEEIDRVVGLELGADDYVVKPFSTRELVLRAKALLARPRVQPEELRRAHTQENVLRSGQLAVDPLSHRVFLGDDELALTATEFKLITEFLRNKGLVLSREKLLENVWGYSFEGYARTVDTHIRRLRQKLGPVADAIETLRGVGYRFNE